MASSLSIDRPACDRSSICCPTSVRASVLPPAPTREVVRVSNPFQPVLPEPIGLSSLNPPSNILSATPSSAAWPKVAVSASPTSTLSFAPLATSSSCRWMLLPNRIGAVTAAAAPAPMRNGAATPVAPAITGAARAAPRPRPNCGICSPTTSPAYVNADPILSTSVDCIRSGCTRDSRPRS